MKDSLKDMIDSHDYLIKKRNDILTILGHYDRRLEESLEDYIKRYNTFDQEVKKFIAKIKEDKIKLDNAITKLSDVIFDYIEKL